MTPETEAQMPADPRNARARFVGGVTRRVQARHSLIRGLAGLLILGVVWEIAGRARVWPLALPPLTSIIGAAGDLIAEGTLQRHMVLSFTAFLGGFLLAAIVGIALGMLVGTSRKAREYLDPLISGLYATPVIALAPLFVVIFGIGLESKAAVVFLVALFPILINTATGIRATDRIYIEVGLSFCANRRQLFTKVLLPSALSYVVAGLRLGTGRGLLGVVAGELFGARGGLGYLILTSAQVFQIADVWVGVFTLAAAGILAMSLLETIEHRLAPWRYAEG